MPPVLLDLGFLKIYTFGVFLLLSFFWGAFFLWKNISLISYKEDEVFDGLFFSLFGGFLIGRVVFILLHLSDFGFNIGKMILVNGYPGIDGFGVLAGLLLSLKIFSMGKKIEFRKFIDYAIGPLFLSLGIIKLGAFFSGSEIGAQTNFFLSLKYPNLDGSRHLTAFYESVLFFLASYFATKIVFIIRREKLFSGFNLLFFLWYYGLVYFVFDSIKSFKTVVLSYSFNMGVGGILVLTVGLYFLYYFRKSIFKLDVVFGKVKNKKSHEKK